MVDKKQILLDKPLIRTVDQFWAFRQVCWFLMSFFTKALKDGRRSEETKSQMQFVLDFIKEIWEDYDNVSGS